MSRSSLRYRTATFPRSPAKFSSMVNIRSSLKLHRRSKTEGGQGDTLPRTPVPITTNIEEEEEEEEEENEAIRAEVRAAEAKKLDLSHERGGGRIDAKKVAQAAEAEASQGDANSFHERDELAEEKEEVEKIEVNDVETVDSEDIVMENSSEANMEGELNQTEQMEDEKEEEDGEENLQNKHQTVVTQLSVSLSNGSSNGYNVEEEEDSEEESVEDSTIAAGTTLTLLDDENLSALRPVSVTRHSSTISSNELGILAEEEEEDESDGGQISFTARESSISNPFDGLEEKEEGSLSKASSKRSVHFDHGEFIFTNGKANGMLESHFGYDDKKNPFMDTFDDS